MKFLLIVSILCFSFSGLCRTVDVRSTVGEEEFGHHLWKRWGICRQVEFPQKECRYSAPYAVRVVCRGPGRFSPHNVVTEGYMSCSYIQKQKKYKSGRFRAHVNSVLFSDKGMHTPKTTIGVNRYYEECRFKDGSRRVVRLMEDPFSECRKCNEKNKQILCKADIICPDFVSKRDRFFSFKWDNLEQKISTQVVCRAVRKEGVGWTCPAVHLCIMDQSIDVAEDSVDASSVRRNRTRWPSRQIRGAEAGGSRVVR